MALTLNTREAGEFGEHMNDWGASVFFAEFFQVKEHRGKQIPSPCPCKDFMSGCWKGKQLTFSKYSFISDHLLEILKYLSSFLY